MGLARESRHGRDPQQGSWAVRRAHPGGWVWTYVCKGLRTPLSFHEIHETSSDVYAFG